MPHTDFDKVPHLITSSQGPLQHLERHLLSQQSSIESWLREQFRLTPPPIYCSVDLRNAGFKIAPVDTNLFPAGFNNLNPDFFPLCIRAIQATMEKICPSVKSILLIPEDHTRNVHYYENIAIICDIFSKAGYEIRVGTLLPNVMEPKTIDLPSGKKLNLEPLVKDKKRIFVDSFSPNLIILNNDLSAGVPDLLQGVNQLILPPVTAGWYSRLKSTHFNHYQAVAHEFCERVDLDPWLISPLFRYCGRVNFMVKGEEHCLLDRASDLLNEIKTKYKQYHIEQKPFLVIKADSGTYGMAVMMIQDPKELMNLNRKERTRMTNIKGGREVNQVIIQEGVYTVEKWGPQQSVAEPVIYMIGEHVVGGFYRIHSSRGMDENLNAPGMSFEPLAFAESSFHSDDEVESNANRFYPYSVIGRLALIAAAREIGDTKITGQAKEFK